MSKRHISIIDDDYICRMVVRKQVASSAYETRTSEFENGQAAVDYYIENSAAPAELPDVLFLDIFMPILDGWAILRTLCRALLGHYKIPTDLHIIVHIGCKRHRTCRRKPTCVGLYSETC